MITFSSTTFLYVQVLGSVGVGEASNGQLVALQGEVHLAEKEYKKALEK